MLVILLFTLVELIVVVVLFIVVLAVVLSKKGTSPACKVAVDNLKNKIEKYKDGLDYTNPPSDTELQTTLKDWKNDIDNLKKQKCWDDKNAGIIESTINDTLSQITDKIKDAGDEIKGPWTSIINKIHIWWNSSK